MPGRGDTRMDTRAAAVPIALAFIACNHRPLATSDSSKVEAQVIEVAAATLAQGKTVTVLKTTSSDRSLPRNVEHESCVTEGVFADFAERNGVPISLDQRNFNAMTVSVTTSATAGWTVSRPGFDTWMNCAIVTFTRCSPECGTWTVALVRKSRTWQLSADAFSAQTSF